MYRVYIYDPLDSIELVVSKVLHIGKRNYIKVLEEYEKENWEG
jgi:hypothetical protein